MSGKPQLVLSDMGFTNNGAFYSDSSTVVFSGGHLTWSPISGSSPVSFYRLTVNKSYGYVEVQKDIAAADTVKIAQGNLRLFAAKLDLGTTGVLNEWERAYALALDQGRVRATAYLDLQQKVNPGNLGLTIQPMDAKMGWTTVERTGTPTFLSHTTNLMSIRRVYTVTSENDQNLNASVWLQYFPSELQDPVDQYHLAVYGGDSWSGPWTSVGVDSNNGIMAKRSGLNAVNALTLAGWIAKAPGYDATVNIYPNPTTGVFTLSVYSPETKTYTGYIANLSGIVMNLGAIFVKAGMTRTLQVNMSSLPPGLYYVLPDGYSAPSIPIRKL